MSKRKLSNRSGMVALTANGFGIAEVGMKQRIRFGMQVAGMTTAGKVLDYQFSQYNDSRSYASETHKTE